MPRSTSSAGDEAPLSSTSGIPTAPAVVVGQAISPQIVDSSRRSRSQRMEGSSRGARPSSSDAPATLNLASMAASLPDYPDPQSHHVSPNQQYPSQAPSGARFAYQVQQPGAPFDPRTASSPQMSPSWGMQYAQQYHQQFQRPQLPGGSNPGSHRIPGNYPQPSPTQPGFSPNPVGYLDQSWVAQMQQQQQQHQQQHQGQQQQQHQQQMASYQYPTATYSTGSQQLPGRPGPVYPMGYSQRGSSAHAQHQHGQQDLLMSGDMAGQYPNPGAYGGAGYLPRSSMPNLSPGSAAAGSRRGSGESSTSLHPSMPRGPPRKPRQSGYALWVGNLPPSTLVIDLKDHFSRDAKDDIESVFLISKSNCAFVNYNSEAACAAAMTRFHDSRFQGVRLVCRLRRTSANPAGGAPPSPVAAAGAATGVDQDTEPSAGTSDAGSSGANTPVVDKGKQQDRGSSASTSAEKFFVVKSLTLEDLELSVKNGIWATQAHNEATLNKAYESADAVYLIFSANKSGEYFGYARMASRIDDSSSTIEWTPKAAPAEEADLPKAIPTPATATAPRGRIIDDSARGTIFWEAEVDEDAEASRAEDDSSSKDDETKEGPSIHKEWGKPFKIEWQSTTRLPFYRTRGLRNPWNANREVKIARDGTELEPSVGRRLLQMFDRPGPRSRSGSYGPQSAGQAHYESSQMQMPGPY